jgi:hypothetical protein
MNKKLAVYIGAGLDLKIIKNIPNVKNFVFVDSQPTSEFGLEECWLKDPGYIFNCFCPSWAPFINDYSRPNFITNLKKTAIKENMTLISEEVNKKLTFQYNNQIIDYFVNISVPEHLSSIENDIKNFNHLIVSGFFPHHSLLDYTKKNITFWGNMNTKYKQTTQMNCLNNKDIREDEKTIIYKLNSESLYEKKFKNFKIIENNNRVITFKFWENFVIFSQKLY